jgi:hypothetical protein
MSPFLTLLQCADIECSKQKSTDPNYGKKKGRFAVCELVAPYHNREIAEAGDDLLEIHESCAINQAFYDCVLAAPSTLQTRPLIRRDDDSAP